MKSSQKSTNNIDPEVVELGRVIAQATHQENVRIQKNMASAAKRKESMLRNAAEKMFNKNY